MWSVLVVQISQSSCEDHGQGTYGSSTLTAMTCGNRQSASEASETYSTGWARNKIPAFHKHPLDKSSCFLSCPGDGLLEYHLGTPDLSRLGAYADVSDLLFREQLFYFLILPV